MSLIARGTLVAGCGRAADSRRRLGGAGRRLRYNRCPVERAALPLRQRGHRARRRARRRRLRLRLPRHAVHGDRRGDRRARTASTPSGASTRRSPLETAVGASLAGVRTIVTMKHVGLNVAADPFMTAVAHGRQRRPRRRQRRRPRHALLAERAGQPPLRPLRQGPDARAVGQPGGLRLRRRGLRALRGVRHAGAAAHDHADLRTAAGSVAAAGAGRCRSRASTRATSTSTSWSRSTPAQRNRLRPRAPGEAARRAPRSPRSTCSRRAPRTSASSPRASPTHYAREAFPKAWFLKLGMSHPLPYAQGRAPVRSRSRVSPWSRSWTRSSRSRSARSGLPVIGKEAIPADGELDQETVFRALEPYVLRKPPRRRGRSCRRRRGCATRRSRRRACRCGRPCSARAARTARSFAALRKHKLAPMGDIGCYTLGALPPLLAMDSCLCMGAEHRHDGRLQQGARAQGGGGASSATPPSSTPASRRSSTPFYNEVEGMRRSSSTTAPPP